MPPKTPRASTFQNAREPPGTTSGRSTPQRSGWERWQDSQAGMPGMASTNRPPQNRPKFAPATPGGDEPQAQASAYFKVSSRDDRSTNSKSQNPMPPPPSPAPTAKRPDPLHSFKEHAGINEPFGRKQPRAGTQSQRGSAEGLNSHLSPNTLHRSATTATSRSSNSRTGFYESQPGSGGPNHVRTASASSNQRSAHHSTSPAGRKDSRLPGMYSSSSSSASSSDNDAHAPLSAKTHVPQSGKRQSHVPAPTQSSSRFNLYAKAGDEKMAPQATRGNYSSTRRHSAIDLNSDKTPEGFHEHRMRREAEREQQPNGDSKIPGSPVSNSSQPSLARSHSWQEKADHRAKWGSPPKDEDPHPDTGGQAGKTPMYAFQGSNPFSSPPLCASLCASNPPSDKWSDQWPFMSPKKPKMVTAEAPPYWAIPSSLPPPEESEYRKPASTRIASHSHMRKVLKADHDSFVNSFKVPFYPQKAPLDTTPLRTHSSERIDTRFSPDGWHPKFFEAPESNRTSTPQREVSPSKGSTAQQFQQQPQPSTAAPTGHEVPLPTPSTAAPNPPPPNGQDKYYEERWVPHLNDMKFDMPQSDQARSPIRPNTRKRTRPRGPKPVNAQPSVEDVDDEPTAGSAAGESLESSKANSDVDAMDIDEPTPPKANGPERDDTARIPDGVPHKPRRAPTLPPRMNRYGQPDAGAVQLDLGDLRVYPLGPSNEGLCNMNDMTADLPFESRAAPQKPATVALLQRPDLPKPPKWPEHPQSLTETACQRFGQEIRAYMPEWHKFNTKMTDLLIKRKNFLHDCSNCDWFDIQSSGYDDYMKGLGELQRARVHYNAACESHLKAMQDLGLWRLEMERNKGRGVPA